MGPTDLGAGGLGQGWLGSTLGGHESATPLQGFAGGRGRFVELGAGGGSPIG